MARTKEEYNRYQHKLYWDAQRTYWQGMCENANKFLYEWALFNVKQTG